MSSHVEETELRHEERMQAVVKELSYMHYPMTFVEYAEAARSTAVYPGQGEFGGMAYVGLGLTGESGEVAEKIKKTWRDGGASIKDPQFREELAKELGDVLWYVAAAAEEIGYPLALIAEMNLEKLRSRKERNAIAGSGDNR